MPKQKKMTIDELLAHWAAIGIGAGGLGMATAELGGSASGIPLGVVGIALLLLAAKDAKLHRRLRNHYILEDQTPDFKKLAAQLISRTHIIRASYSVNGEPFIVVVVHPKQAELEKRLRTGEAERIEEILEKADSGLVVFTAGPQNWH